MLVLLGAGSMVATLKLGGVEAPVNAQRRAVAARHA
jgi:hypothetical protein